MEDPSSWRRSTGACGLASVPDPPTTPDSACPDLAPSPSSPTPSFLPPSCLFPWTLHAPRGPPEESGRNKGRWGGGVRADTRKQSRRPGPRAEGLHLLGRPRGSPPTKALVVLCLNPSLHLQGCSVFIGAMQEPCTGSGAALRTCGAQTGLSGKQLGKLPGSLAETSQQSPSGDIRVPRASRSLEFGL